MDKITPAERYDHAHKIGKITAWSISTVVLMFLLHDVSLIERILWAVFNLLYWFGANTVAYLYEEVRQWKHQHKKL